MSIQSIVHNTFLQLQHTIMETYNALIRRYMLHERFGVGREYDRSKAKMLISLERIILREEEYFTDRQPQLREKVRVLINSIKDIYE